MRGIADFFSISKEFDDIVEIPFAENAILLYSSSNEERSALATDFSVRRSDVQLVYVTDLDNQSASLLIDDELITVNLRSNIDVQVLINKFEDRNVYLDITGLIHSSWAWLVRVMLKRSKGCFWAVYSEPGEYRSNSAPLEGQIFDLSERISGIAPLPGFAKLSHYTSDSFIFMPLLGFEGARLAHIMEDVQPSRELTFPVFGVPGFQHDFPFYTYQGNKLTLEREGIWKNWRYEKANCPASIYSLGKSLLEEYNKTLRIAIIGTKPHALGAVLLKITNPKSIDLVYDHAVRKIGRTSGKSKTLCYSLNEFKEIN